MIRKPDPSRVKVIARLKNGSVLKGYLAGSGQGNFEDLLRDPSASPPNPIELYPVDSDEITTVPLDSLKALFIVKSFEGRREYHEVKFFDKQPPSDGLWVRTQFHDKETLEGVVQNSLTFLVDRGFFIKPPDPRSNNEIVYVIKSSLSDFRILGVMPRR